jgi:RTX calcium-binding nonapeptide repeat (4 copies)
MNYCMDFDPHLIRERNEGMVREVTSMCLQAGSRNNEDDQERKEKRVMSKKTRRSAILLLAGIAALVLSSTAASAALRIGTDNADTLVGTNQADSINGKAGNDTLKGLAGNDVYNFGDDFGNDTLEDKAIYTAADGSRLPGGTDTLNFSGVHPSGVSAPITVYLIPQWGAQFNRASTVTDWGAQHTITLTQSSEIDNTTVVENVTGGPTVDEFYGGGETNTLKPGGGSRNELWDYGGNDGSAVNNRALMDLPGSSDIYKGFGAAPNGAENYVYDFGGTQDKLVLPGESSDYYIDRINLDNNREKELGKLPTEESLKVYNPTNDSTVFVAGHFGEYFYLKDGKYMPALLNGQIEKLVFADTVIDTTG